MYSHHRDDTVAVADFHDGQCISDVIRMPFMQLLCHYSQLSKRYMRKSWFWIERMYTLGIDDHDTCIDSLNRYIHLLISTNQWSRDESLILVVITCSKFNFEGIEEFIGLNCALERSLENKDTIMLVYLLRKMQDDYSSVRRIVKCLYRMSKSDFYLDLLNETDASDLLDYNDISEYGIDIEAFMAGVHIEDMRYDGSYFLGLIARRLHVTQNWDMIMNNYTPYIAVMSSSEKLLLFNNMLYNDILFTFDEFELMGGTKTIAIALSYAVIESNNEYWLRQLIERNLFDSSVLYRWRPKVSDMIVVLNEYGYICSDNKYENRAIPMWLLLLILESSRQIYAFIMFVRLIKQSKLKVKLKLTSPYFIDVYNRIMNEPSP